MSLDLGQCSDGELAALALGGQERAYREFLRRYRDPVYRLVRNNVRDGTEALDLTQETFVAAFSALRRYDPERPFKIWIARIAINKCRDWARRRAVRSFFTSAVSLDSTFDVASDVASPEDEAADRAELAHVRSAITQLPHRLREAITLRAMDGLSQAETAEILGVNEKVVETRLYRARNQLRQILAGTLQRGPG